MGVGLILVGGCYGSVHASVGWLFGRFGLACRPFRAAWLVGFGDCGIFGLVYCMFCGAINSVGMYAYFTIGIGGFARLTEGSFAVDCM